MRVGCVGITPYICKIYDDARQMTATEYRLEFALAQCRPKSTTASNAATAINPAFKPIALQNRVAPNTEDVFHDEFWNALDIVVNALDNVNARLYVDSRCVYFGKPLLESGTLGPKCNTQVIIPQLTENYGELTSFLFCIFSMQPRRQSLLNSAFTEVMLAGRLQQLAEGFERHSFVTGASRDPPEKQAPMCTVHSFPHNIDHCLTFARSEFEGLLEKAPAEANAYLADPRKYITTIKQASDAAAREQLERVVEVLFSERCVTFEECIAWARHKFEVWSAVSLADCMKLSQVLLQGLILCYPCSINSTIE